jgi:hypothetical protein
MTPYWQDETVALHLGDCLDVLAGMKAASVDAIVTDPPAAIGFMGKDWDSNLGSRDRWIEWLAERMAEALRVLKPGGHALVWALPRTAGWTQIALEDAGFEIRDCVTHLFGSGFPKSLDVSKAIDKRAQENIETKRRIAAVAEVIRSHREAKGMTPQQVSMAVVGTPSGACWNWEHQQLPSVEMWPGIKAALGIPDKHDGLIEGDRARFIAAEREVIKERTAIQGGGTSLQIRMGERREAQADITAPATEDAARWEGWGTALKPGQEMWWLARKPLISTVAANVLQYGTGALNIDGCRVGSGGQLQWAEPRDMGYHGGSDAGSVAALENSQGRWPPNVLLGPEAAAELDRQSGVLAGCGGPKQTDSGDASMFGIGQPGRTYERQGGGASRFFPVFRPEHVCVLYGMLSGCERVSGAAAKSPAADLQPSAAVSGVSDSSLPQDAARSEPSTPNAPTAKSPSAPSPETTRATAPVTAPMRPVDWSALRAASAENLCGSCATAIAQSLAATQHGQSPMPTLGLPSTDAFSERILTQNLALYAEALARHGTTSTTTALTTSLGCVVAAISACTTRESDSPTRRSGPPSFKYVAKAPAHERPRGEDGTAHPTVKPVDLLRWMVRLVTPPGGLVLDCFAGSGTTAEACIVEGFRCVLVEKDPAYAELIRTRLRKDIQPAMFGLEAS